MEAREPLGSWLPGSDAEPGHAFAFSTPFPTQGQAFTGVAGSEPRGTGWGPRREVARHPRLRGGQGPYPEGAETAPPGEGEAGRLRRVLEEEAGRRRPGEVGVGVGAPPVCSSGRPLRCCCEDGRKPGLARMRDALGHCTSWPAVAPSCASGPSSEPLESRTPNPAFRPSTRTGKAHPAETRDEADEAAESLPSGTVGSCTGSGIRGGLLRWEAKGTMKREGGRLLPGEGGKVPTLGRAS